MVCPDLADNALLAILLVIAGVLIGMLGYHVFEGYDWVDAFANAAMILAGMGPFGQLRYWQGKIFAGAYALLSGLIFIALIAIIIAPLIKCQLDGLGFITPGVHHRRVVLNGNNHTQY